jgi:hypothetical protein
LVFAAHQFFPLSLAYVFFRECAATSMSSLRSFTRHLRH